MDRQQLWHPCMPHTTIMDEENLKLSRREMESFFIKMAQVDIIIQDIMEESKKPIHEMCKETKIAFAKYLWSHL